MFDSSIKRGGTSFLNWFNVSTLEQHLIKRLQFRLCKLYEAVSINWFQRGSSRIGLLAYTAKTDIRRHAHRQADRQTTDGWTGRHAGRYKDKQMDRLTN